MSGLALPPPLGASRQDIPHTISLRKVFVVDEPTLHVARPPFAPDELHLDAPVTGPAFRLRVAQAEMQTSERCH